MVALIEGKLLALFIGLAICALGIAFMRFGAPAVTALNRLYRRLPFRFQYPSWWHDFMGWMFICFGLLFALTGLLFVNGLPK